MDNADNASVSDEALLEAMLRTHSHTAFSTLVRRHATRFRNVAFRFVGSREEAEDIVQQAFLKLWEKPQLWNAQGGAKFTTWFYRIIANQSMDYQRKHKTVPILDGEDFADDAAGADTMLEMDEQKKQVERAFRSLPEHMQASLNLSFFEPVPNQQAAVMMGMSVKAFQSLLIRAKKQFKEQLLQDEQPKAIRYESRRI